MQLETREFHSVQSATGVEVLLRIAGPGARAYAFIIDWHIRLLLAAAWLLVSSYLSSGALLPRATAGESGLRFALAVAAPTAIYFLYHPLLELVMRGRTPGKRFAGVRIVNQRGATPGRKGRSN